MRKIGSRTPFHIEYLISAITLAVLVAYTYGNLAVVPYLGFRFFTGRQEIEEVFARTATGPTLQKGDILLKVDGITFDDYINHYNNDFIWKFKNLKSVAIQVLRDGRTISVLWPSPGVTLSEFRSRFINIWWLAYAYWFFGTLAILLMRPKDRFWRLTIAYSYLTSLWILFGASSIYGLWGSLILMRVILWFSVPVYWQFHWFFPVPIDWKYGSKKLPVILIITFYLAAGILAASELGNLLFVRTYFLAFFLALIGSLVLLFIHAVQQPLQRNALVFLGLATVSAILPYMIRLFSNLELGNTGYQVFLLLALQVIPVAYFYILVRPQARGWNLRTNRLVTRFVYLALAGNVSLILTLLAIAFPASLVTTFWIGLAMPLMATILAIVVYPRFELWFEQKLLGIPIPPRRLLEVYSARITTSLDIDRLIVLIRDQIMPTLLVRQAALLRLRRSGSESAPFLAIPIFSSGISEDELPSQSEIWPLILQAGELRATSSPQAAYPCAWARLILVLSIENRPVGLCLFGKRDPDDFYGPTEIPTIQILMNQTALALANIDQAERLHALNQANIDRRETERRRLALELHDGVLGELAVLSMKGDESQAGPEFAYACQSAADRIRQIINGLRPTMLDFGLYTALQQLVDDTSIQAGEGVEVSLELEACEARFPVETELHLYRILQQACQNSASHAQAKRIIIRGKIDAGYVDITVQDDGVGFPAGEGLDLPNLLTHNHFGVAGMFERANLIGAQVHLSSTPQHGTQLKVVWINDKSQAGK